MAAKSILVKRNIGDPETLETFYAGSVYTVGDSEGADISEEQAARLRARHGEWVVDLSETESLSKDEVAEAARVAGVDDSGSKAEIAKRLKSEATG